jgi:hypothetical protein
LKKIINLQKTAKENITNYFVFVAIEKKTRLCYNCPLWISTEVFQASGQMGIIKQLSTI